MRKRVVGQGRQHRSHGGHDGCAEEGLQRRLFSLIGEACFLLDADCRIIELTTASRRLLGEGLVVRSEIGTLVVTDPAGDASLRTVMADLGEAGIEGASRALILPSLDGHPPSLAVLGLLSDLQGASPPRLFLLRILGPTVPCAARAADLGELFGLTPAEAHIALKALAARRLQELATEVGISLATARTHLQRVFEKTGTHRQSELIKLLMSYARAPC